jgi:GDPmannose 4,6-dehydratase
MCLILKKKKPKDYVIGTGKAHSVREFAKLAFEHVGLDYKKYIKIDKNLFRPAEVDLLIADFKMAKKELKWEPRVEFKELVKSMVDEDIKYVGSK